MKIVIASLVAVLLASSSAHATQETLTAAGPLICSAISMCAQTTADSLFSLEFLPTYPTSGPSPSGFNVNEQSLEIFNAKGGFLDLNSLQIALTGSDVYNGVNFLGAIQLDVQDAAGNWSYRAQWSTSVGSAKGIYVTFNGRNAAAPYVRGVQGIRLSGINGATAFRVGMLNLTAR